MTERELVFEAKGNSYRLPFPTVGQFMDMESKRMFLSKGTYSDMLNSRLISSAMAMDFIDMISTLSVLCPDLVKDIKTDNILELDLMDAKQLLDIYKKDIAPWVDSWMKLLRDVVKPDGSDE